MPFSSSERSGSIPGSGRRAVGGVQRAGLQLRRVEDHLGAGLLVLLEVAIGDVLELDEEVAFLLPLAKRAELDIADDGAELVGAHVGGQLRLVDLADAV